MSAKQSRSQPREDMEVFRALPCEGMAVRDAQDLMAYPFFALGKSRRVVPIDFCAGDVAIRVEGMVEHGLATIWDADVLIWAASQVVEARAVNITTSLCIATTRSEMLR